MFDKDDSMQKFGGPWTKEKLNIFTAYLNSYLTALKYKKFGKIYIDAFAGTGEIDVNDGGQRLIGSAKIALAAEQKFNEYYFIEKDPNKVKKLQEMVNKDFWWMEGRVHVYCGDAAEVLSKILNMIDWHYNRGLLFLDPYATQVKWNMLEQISATGAIDVWYLFPYHALNRMLPKDKDALVCGDCLDQLLGDPSWRTAFYKKDLEMDLFAAQEHETKQVKLPEIEKFILKRLEGTFAKVSSYPRVFRNSKNSPMFIFFFAVSNNSRSAQNLAFKMADYILKNLNVDKDEVM